MRKLIAVGVLVGGLLAGAGSAMAQPLPNQGGIGDPLTLAASGVLIPYFTGGPAGTVALIEVASPVADNPNLHMLFFNTACTRIGSSVGIPETVNDIAFQDPNQVAGVPLGTSGLVAIAGVDVGGSFLIPLTAPIHSRVYQFTPTDGRSRVYEPIILDTAEFGNLSPGGDGRHLWSPLRTGATFYAPLETLVIHTELTLICPRPTIQGTGAVVDPSKIAFGNGQGGPTSTTGFPVISPPFKAAVTNELFARIYNTNEVFLRDSTVDCDCLRANVSVNVIDSLIYKDPVLAALGTYTELVMNNVSPNGSFTGYRAVFALGSNLNNFWGRLSNGSQASINGVVTNAR